MLAHEPPHSTMPQSTMSKTKLHSQQLLQAKQQKLKHLKKLNSLSQRQQQLQQPRPTIPASTSTLTTTPISIPAPRSNTSACNYAPDELVLCYHGPLLYKAKILIAEVWNEPSGLGYGPHYYVHYKGWSPKWDDWVPESRALMITEENLALQTKLLNDSAANEAVPKRATAGGGGVGGGGKDKDKEKGRDGSLTPGLSNEKAKKRGREAADDEFLKRPEIKLVLPPPLKTRLVDDWERITKSQLLVPLPRHPTVAQVLDMYRDHKKGKGDDASTKTASKLPTDAFSAKEKSDDAFNEIVDGLKMYFDKALGTILLYKFERQQYIEVRNAHEGKPMSEIYGAEHLLRLFVQIPMLVAHTNMSQDAVKTLQAVFTDFLKFFQKTPYRFFVTEYEAASPAYLSLAKSN